MIANAVETFVLPPSNEATTTPERRGVARDGVRLLVTDRRSGGNRDATFRDLPAFLRAGDLIVANDSATLSAALAARRLDGRSFALHLSTQIAAGLWIAEPRTPDAVVPGERVALAAGSATFFAPVDDAHPRLWYTGLTVRGPVEAFLAAHGTPIRYPYVVDALPPADYQTVFARTPGSAEMPSAGRPFTQETLEDLRDAGVALATVTLHTGVSSPERHERPYREQYDVPDRTARAVNDAHRRGGRVIAIGTTVVRALESAASDRVAIASSGWTDLIVTPQRGVALVDAVLTGFHEPRASHLDLLRAFASDDVLTAAYAHALAAGYLWHEFGDVQLLVAG